MSNRRHNSNECGICVRDADGEDGLCCNCRAYRRLTVATVALNSFMSSDQIATLVEFLEAKAEHDAL